MSHGPTRARRPVGELQGPPPSVPRQVTDILVRVEQLSDGRWRLTMPRLPAWGAAASTPSDLAAAIRRGFTEAQVAAHSDWRNVAYDADVPDYRRRRPKRSAPSKNRRDVHPPTEWRETADGRWMSPKGLLYPPECEVVLRVRRKLFRLGLGPNPDAEQRDRRVRLVEACAS